MHWIWSFYHKERSYLERLSFDSKQLVKSIFLFNGILPILNFFLTAFLFRKTQSLTFVAVFFLFFFIGVALGAYMNGILLRRISAVKLMIIGLTLEGLVIFTLMFQSVFSISLISGFGFAYGVTAGIYWLNRNLLTLQTTQSANRIYFSSLESLSKAGADVAVPLAVGVFFSIGVGLDLYSYIDGYRFLAFTLFFVILWISRVAGRISSSVTPVSLFIAKPRRSWYMYRVYNFSLGVLTIGVILLPPLMVLSLVGDEGALGVLQSIASLISALFVYGLSKSLQVAKRFKLIVASVVTGIIGVLVFAFTYSPFGVFIFMVSIAVSQPFWWAHMSSLSYDLIESEYYDIARRYAAICDREFYITLGRVTAILLFIGLIYWYSNDAALRFTPLMFIVFQVVLLLSAKSIEKEIAHISKG